MLNMVEETLNLHKVATQTMKKRERERERDNHPEKLAQEKSFVTK